ncbi:unnamed protein product, partial [Brassica oleracea]
PLTTTLESCSEWETHSLTSLPSSTTSFSPRSDVKLNYVILAEEKHLPIKQHDVIQYR